MGGGRRGLSPRRECFAMTAPSTCNTRRGIEMSQRIEVSSRDGTAEGNGVEREMQLGRGGGGGERFIQSKSDE